MNCPELVKQFEDNRKKKSATTDKKTGKVEPKKKRKSTSRSKKAKVDDSDRSDGDLSLPLDNDAQTDKSQQNDHEQDSELHSPRQTSPSPILNGDPSLSDPPTKSPAPPASKDVDADDEALETTADEDQEQTETNDNTTAHDDEDDDHNNNNRSIEMVDKSAPVEETVSNTENTEPASGLRLRIPPDSTSPLSLTLNDSDNNNNHTHEKSSMENANNTSTDQEITEIINDDDEDVIDSIEAVKNDKNGISFRIKLVGQKDAHWIAAKVANRKYPQAVIAFWESHVEFT